MRYALILIAIIVMYALAESNLTITPADNGTDILWLSWTDAEDTGMVARYDGATFQNRRVFPNSPDGVSSTITQDPSGRMHLIFSNRDALFALNPSGSMITEGETSLEHRSGCFRTGLLRRSTRPDFGLLGIYKADYMSSGASFTWQTVEYTVSESGQITLGDSLELGEPYPANSSNYPSCYIPMVYPVMNASRCPVIATRQMIPGGPIPPTPYSWRIATLCHNTTASALYLTADTLTYSTSVSETPELVTSGSCTSNALFLWIDSAQTIYYSLHDCERRIISTAPFPGQGPDCSQPSALSANPRDAGMLLVWNDGKDILCRHYENGWNQITYIIAEDISCTTKGNISVCSTESGYWVACLAEEKSDPEVFFVDRNNVASNTDYSESENPLRVTTFPNPFCEVLLISLESADNPIHAILYDHTGRVAREDTSVDGTLVWATRELQVGSYLIRVTSGNKVLTETAVIVR